MKTRGPLSDICQLSCPAWLLAMLRVLIVLLLPGPAFSQGTGIDPQAATAQPQAKSAAPSPVKTGKALPLGTVVESLPAGCTSAPIGGVEYYQCGADQYRAVFQGNNLVYVTAQP